MRGRPRPRRRSPAREERRGQRRAALEQHPADVAVEQLGEQRGRRRRPRLTQRRAPRRRGPGRSAGTRSPAVDDDPQRLAAGVPAVGVADGELRVVGQRPCPMPTTTASQRGPQPVDVGARRLAGDPAAGAVGGGDPAVEGGGELPDDERAAARARRSATAERAGLRLGLLDAELDVDARRRAAGPRRRRRARVGSGTATTTRATPAAISASAHGPVRPVCAQGSRVTTAVPPRARSPACGQRGRPRRAGRRAAAVAPSPDRACRRRRGSPRRRPGWGWSCRARSRRAARARCHRAACSARQLTAHPRHRRGGLRAQRGDRLRRVVGAVDGRAGDEHVGAGLGGLLDGVGVDAAVDLDEQRAGGRCRRARGPRGPWAARRR